jgi:hypothetical protein
MPTLLQVGYPSPSNSGGGFTGPKATLTLIYANCVKRALDMSGGNEVTRNLLQQEPGRKIRHAIAADTPKIPHLKVKRHDAGGRYCITPSVGAPFRIVVSPRDCWALEELRKAGTKGCTPAENPAPRWSAYVFNLRELGVEIETITEQHAGEFPGHHGRYVLHSLVSPD